MPPEGESDATYITYSFSIQLQIEIKSKGCLLWMWSKAFEENLLDADLKAAGLMVGFTFL